MALTVTEKVQPKHHVSFQVGFGYVRQYTRTLQVKADGGDLSAGPATIRAYVADNVVGIGNSYAYLSETDGRSFCQSLEVAHIDDQSGPENYWIVTVEYGPYDPAQRPENPLEQPPEVSFDAAQFQAAVGADRDGNAVVNSAGDAFDPPAEKEDSQPVLQVVLNQQTFSLPLAYQYRDNVNTNAWLGADAGTIKASPVKAQRLWHPACQWYYRVEYEFKFNPQTWQKKILDAGFTTISGSSRNMIKDTTGELITAPALLDGSGAKLGVGGTPVFLPFDVYAEADFTAAFGLDAILGDVFA